MLSDSSAPDRVYRLYSLKFNFIQFPSIFLAPWTLNSKTHDDDDDDDDELDGRRL